MRIGVVADHVPRAHDVACNIRPLLDVSADQKERRFDIVASENVEKAKRMRIVGAVIIGKRQHS
jgi:hypothetical protein